MDKFLEKKLVASSQSGETSAYNALVKVYSGHVFAICMGMLGNTHDAEDMTQKALLKGFKQVKQLHNNGRFGPWLTQIAKNVCIDFIRERGRKQNCLFESEAVSANQQIEHQELEAALQKLPQEQRLVLMLYYFDGHSTGKIAETLDISRAAVQARLSRARKQLRQLLSARGDI
ncbi:MAG: RNA polymerase sigma factor [Planctomycetota bacterium]